MRRLCSGYYDEGGVLRRCPDPVLDPGDGPDDTDVSHGLCPACHARTVEIIDQLAECDADHLRQAAR